MKRAIYAAVLTLAALMMFPAWIQAVYETAEPGAAFVEITVESVETTVESVTATVESVETVESITATVESVETAESVETVESITATVESVETAVEVTQTLSEPTDAADVEMNVAPPVEVMPDDDVTLARPDRTVTIESPGDAVTIESPGDAVTVEPTDSALTVESLNDAVTVDPPDDTVTMDPPDDILTDASVLDGDDGYYTVTVKNGSGSGRYQSGDTVHISADPAPRGKKLRGWSRPSYLVINFVMGTTTLEATFTMPDENVTLTPTYEDLTLRTVTVIGGVGGGQYYSGDTVHISADPAPAGKYLGGWSRPEDIRITYTDTSTLDADFTMPDRDVRVTAVYYDWPTVTVIGGVVEGGTEIDGTGSAQVRPGDTVHIWANPAPDGKRLKAWQRPSDIPIQFVSGTTTLEATFTMPTKSVTLTAVYEDDVLRVTVIGGTGSGIYAEGDTVSITADPAPNGKRLKGWLMTSGQVSLQWGANSSQTLAATFVMPAYPVTLMVTYWDVIPGPGNETYGSIRVNQARVIVETRVRGGNALENAFVTAAYDADGRLLSLATGTLSEGKGETVMDLTGARSVSAFLFDDKFRPLTGTFAAQLPAA